MPDLNYPPLGFHFSVRFEGVGDVKHDSKFQQVQGLESTIRMKQFTEGGENRITYHLPEMVEYADLVLTRGTMIDSKVTEWCLDAMENFIFNPANIIITLLNNQGAPLISWYAVAAIPYKVKFGELDASKSEVFIETMTLKIRYFNTIKNPQ